MDKFELVSPYKPTGDQPEAIQKLADGIQKGLKSRFYWALRVPARPSQWRTLLHR